MKKKKKPFPLAPPSHQDVEEANDPYSNETFSFFGLKKKTERMLVIKKKDEKKRGRIKQKTNLIIERSCNRKNRSNILF
jgi:hypothetical protein